MKVENKTKKEKTKNEVEEKQVWSAYHSDPSEENRDTLIVFYLRYVKYICGRIAMELPAHISEEDLLSSGVMGLIDAIDKFDPTRDNLFRTYAFNRIRGSVIDELRRLDWVPRSLRKRSREIDKTENSLSHEFGRKATPDEVAEKLGIEEHEVDEVHRDVKSAAFLSLDDIFQQMAGDKSITRMDTIKDSKSLTPKQILENKEFKERLASKIDGLPDNEKMVLVLYYYEDLTLKEIGAVLEVSESRISQLHTQAINRVTEELKKDL